MESSRSPDSRRREISQRLLVLNKVDLVSMLTSVYEGLWRLEADNYPDAEVNGGDFIEFVSAVFVNARVSPNEIE